MKKLLALLAFLFLAQSADAARIVPTPEVPGLSCATGRDADGDTKIGSTDPDCAASTPLLANGNGFRAHAKDAAKVGYTTAADSLSSSGTYLKKTAALGEAVGEVSWWGDWTAGTYYGWIRYRCSQTACVAWFSESEIGANRNNATQAMILPQSADWTWAQISFTGSTAAYNAGLNSGGVRQFTLPTGRAGIYMKSVDGLECDCVDFDPDPDHVRDCPGGGGSQPIANYVFLDKGAETAPTVYNSAAFTNANVATLQGYDSSGGVLAITFKALWDSVTSDVYLSAVVPDTEVLNSGSITGNDDPDWFSVQHDNFDFRVRLDQAQTFDTDMYNVSANAAGYYLDRDWSGVGNASNLATNLATTVAVSTTATEIRYFMKFNLGAITPGTLGLCNFAARDRDSGGVSLIRHFFGTTINALLNANEFGLCEFSGTDVAASGGGGDVTAPTVNTTAEANIATTSATITFNTNEAGTAFVSYGTVSGSLTSTSSSNGCTSACSVTLTGLTPGTLYYYRAKVTDAAALTGQSAEDSFTTASASTATLFVANAASGSGNCSSAANACQFASVWAQVVPGSIVEATAGTYQGTNSMINPSASGKNGTAANPITVRCATPGGCLVDGQNVRRAIGLGNNDYFIIEDFNAANGGCPVVQIGSGADNNIIRRVVAWNAGVSCGANAIVFGNNNNTGNVFEDIAAFGTGRKMFEDYRSTNTRMRRGWFAWTSESSTQPKMALSTGYENYNAIYENIIATWYEPVASQGSQRHGIIGNDQMFQSATTANRCANNKLLGSITYRRATDPIGGIPYGHLQSSGSVDCIEYKNVVAYEGGATFKTTSLTNFQPEFGGPSTNHFLTNATQIGGATASIGSDWSQSGNEDVAMVGAATNIWTGGTTGARVCFRYQNGTLTSTPLWPWPMDQRIVDALTASGRDPDNYFGAGNTLTVAMENIFGPIPTGCRSS